jgi:acyl homoserine lactone synthase
MFIDRATQFKNRLNWDVTVNELGHGRTTSTMPQPALCHLGTGPTAPMAARCADHADARPHDDQRTFPRPDRRCAIQSPLIWECTRFCLSPSANLPAVAAALMLAGASSACASASTRRVGVFDARMLRIYGSDRASGRRMCSAPTGDRRDAISVGLWPFDEEAAPRLIAARSGIPRGRSSAEWFEAFLPPPARSPSPDGPDCRGA